MLWFFPLASLSVSSALCSQVWVLTLIFTGLLLNYSTLWLTLSGVTIQEFVFQSWFLLTSHNTVKYVITLLPITSLQKLQKHHRAAFFNICLPSVVQFISIHTAHTHCTSSIEKPAALPQTSPDFVVLRVDSGWLHYLLDQTTSPTETQLSILCSSGRQAAAFFPQSEIFNNVNFLNI